MKNELRVRIEKHNPVSKKMVLEVLSEEDTKIEGYIEGRFTPVIMSPLMYKGTFQVKNKEGLFREFEIIMEAEKGEEIFTLIAKQQ